MTDIYIVLVDGRGSDTDLFAYADEDAAIAEAKRQVQLNARHPEILDELAEDHGGLNDSMRAGGWIFYQVYGVEGDHVRVQRVELHVSEDVASEPDCAEGCQRHQTCREPAELEDVWVAGDQVVM